jgi:hypothetical protein
MTAAALAPEPELVLRLLSGVADSSDLTREQLLQAVAAYFLLSVRWDRATVRGALERAAAIAPGMAADSHGVRSGYRRLLWGPLMETAVRVWAVASVVPDATTAQVHDVVLGRAGLSWDPVAGWALHAGELVADDDDLGYEVPARLQSCADCGDLTDGHLCPMCRGVVDVG